MILTKKIAILSLVFLFLASSANAYTWDYTPEDPNIVYQTYFDDINIKPSWSNDIKVNKEVVVAVLDSGVDLDHPDLVSNLWINEGEIPNDGIDNDNNSYIDDVVGWDFIDSDNDPEPEITDDYDFTAVNHGTVVAGIVSAVANSKGIIGIAPQAKVMPLRILDSQGVGNTIVLSQAIDYAVENGADIINLSLVGTNYGDTLKKSIVNAYNNGVIIIAASGNEEDQGKDLNEEPHYPVCDIDNVNRVLGVAALDKDKKLTEFSNYGSDCIDISAPGSSFYSTTFNYHGNEDFLEFYRGGWSGTSVAAPVVAATAALLKMNYPEFKPNDIYRIIMQSAQSLKAENPDNYKDLGSGIIDIGAALNLAEDYFNENIYLVATPMAGLEPRVSILDNRGNLKKAFLAYSQNFKGGMNVATGDLDGDGVNEIVTVPLAGGGPHVRVFNRDGELVSQFFAYAANFHGGMDVAIGDINGDGVNEIVTSPLATGGPHIRIFDLHGNVLSEFFAYRSNFYGGVHIDVGDVNNDDKDEIVTVPASQNIPDVRTFDFLGRMKSRFIAYDEVVDDGLNIAVGDVNNDEWPEIITVPSVGHSPHVKVFSLKGRVKGEFMSFTTSLKSGVKVVSGDISGDFLPEILLLPQTGASPLLRVYDHQGLEKDNFYLRPVLDKNGYNFDVL